MPCHAMPCHAMPCHAMPCHAMPCHLVSYRAMTCHVIPCCIQVSHSRATTFCTMSSCTTNMQYYTLSKGMTGRAQLFLCETLFSRLQPLNTHLTQPLKLQGRSRDVHSCGLLQSGETKLCPRNDKGAKNQGQLVVISFRRAVITNNILTVRQAVGNDLERNGSCNISYALGDFSRCSAGLHAEQRRRRHRALLRVLRQASGRRLLYYWIAS